MEVFKLNATVKNKDNILDLCSQYPKLKRQLQLKITENDLALQYSDQTKFDLTEEQIKDIRKRMKDIERTIDLHSSLSSHRHELRTSEEKLFLRYYYVLGLTIEKTAEAMDISRDTVYRIRKRLADNTDAKGAAVI